MLGGTFSITKIIFIMQYAQGKTVQCKDENHFSISKKTKKNLMLPQTEMLHQMFDPITYISEVKMCKGVLWKEMEKIV